MKKLIFLCAAALFSTGILASPGTDPDLSKEILKLFHKDFPEITHQQIYQHEGTYVVYFKDDKKSYSCRVFYSSGGKMLGTYRYYQGSGLSPFIRSKISENFSGKKIFGVTDVTNDQVHFYQIVLEDAHAWYIVLSDDNGDLSLQKKYRKA